MKYWRGYLTAAIFAAITWALGQMGEKYAELVDMVYPYVTRSLQGFLTAWTAGYDFCVWQLLVIILAVVILASLVVFIVFKKSIIQWLGWVLATVSLVTCLNTAVYGLNYYAGPIEHDIRLEMEAYDTDLLQDAAEYYRDKANALAVTMPRNQQGEAEFSSFEELAALTGNGYRKLVRNRSFSIFGGDYTPVKQLGWTAFYTPRNVYAHTSFLTGEAAVSPELPGIALPFAMAHQMAHRLCVAREEAADFSAFLNCEASDSTEYQYSGYFMAYRYLHEALKQANPAAAKNLENGCVNEFKWDLEAFDRFCDGDMRFDRKTSDISRLFGKGAEQSDDPAGLVCDYLVNWYRSEYVTVVVVEQQFDPYDESQVDLSGLARAPEQTEPPTEETDE